MSVIYRHLTAEQGLSLYSNGSSYYLCGRQCEELAIEESFVLKGAYVFGGEEERTIGELSGLLRELWLGFGEEIAFVWLPLRPDDGVHVIFCAKSGESWRIKRQWGFRFSDYGLFLRAGSLVRLKDDGFSVEMAHADITRAETGPVLFMAGGLGLKSADSAVFLPVSGGGAGGFRFRTLPVRGSKGENPLALMDAALCFTKKAREDETGEAVNKGFVDTIKNPLLFPEEPVAFECSLVPNRFWDAALSFLQFQEGQVYKSAFLTPYGDPVRLKTTGNSRLVFASTPERIVEAQGRLTIRSRLYLTYAGAFILEGSCFLPGLFGTEYFDLTRLPETDRILTFIPGQSGFLNEEGRLDGRAEVAWVSLPRGVGYFSQSKSAPLFSPSSTGALLFLPLPLLETEGGMPVPVMFYNLAEQNLEESSWDDTEIYARRYGILTAAANLQSGKENGQDRAAELTAVTPQGMTVGLTAADGVCKNWRWIDLADARLASFVPSAGGNLPIRLWGVDKSLRILFQDTGMGLVFGRPEEILNHVERVEHFNFKIEGWEFCLSPEDWRTGKDSNTVMAVKYSEGKSLRELFSGTEAEGTFSDSVAACCLDSGEPREEYREFLRTIDDPQFQGIVFLNCRVIPDKGREGIDDSLRLILSGIDELTAHHVIFWKNQIAVSDGTVRLEKSFVSALLDYKDGEGLTYSREGGADSPLKYKTVEFTLSIQNNEITRITSASELLIAELFGAPCEKCDGSEGGDCLLIDGVKTRGELTSFRFSLRAGKEYRLSRSELERVSFESVELVSSDTGGLFSLSGELSFLPCEDCDLFSYGSQENEERGLRFDGFKIELKQREGKEAILRPLYNALSFRESPPRDDSFCRRFPVKISRLIAGEDKDSPDAAGYSAIDTPIGQSTLTKPWFGLLFRLPLGTLGGLGDSSPFDLELLVAWSAGETPGFYVGVKLPDILRGGGLDLQGLLKLGFKTVTLNVAKTEGVTRYSFLLKSFAVKILWASFPSGSADIRIVSDDGGRRLGWYAVYREEEK